MRKKLKDDDELGGSLSSPITKEKPTSRFFFSWVEEDDDKPENLSLFSSFLYFFCFFLELQKTTRSGEAHHCLLQCKKKNK